MSKNVSMDNKHGDCCGCPALMSDGRLFMQWQPKGSFNQRLQSTLNLTGDKLRANLQQNPAIADIDGLSDEKLACKPNPKFYIDSSNFHKMMLDSQLAELQVPAQVNGFILKDLYTA